jgi:hypothetical protein
VALGDIDFLVFACQHGLLATEFFSNRTIWWKPIQQALWGVTEIRQDGPGQGNFIRLHRALCIMRAHASRRQKALGSNDT